MDHSARGQSFAPLLSKRRLYLPPRRNHRIGCLVYGVFGCVHGEGDEVTVVHRTDGDEGAIRIAKGFHGAQVQRFIALGTLSPPKVQILHQDDVDRRTEAAEGEHHGKAAQDGCRIAVGRHLYGLQLRQLAGRIGARSIVPIPMLHDAIKYNESLGGGGPRGPRSAFFFPMNLRLPGTRY